MLGAAGGILKPRWSRKRDRRINPRSPFRRAALDAAEKNPDFAVSASGTSNRDVSSIVKIPLISRLRVLKTKCHFAASNFCGYEPVNLLIEAAEEYKTTATV